MRSTSKFAGVVWAFVIGLMLFFLYALNWSGRFLAPVRIGMTKGRVQALVGHPPLVHTNLNGSETWDYSHLWSSEARVHFDTNGLVCIVESD